MLVVSLYRIQRTPWGVVGVVHESGTKTYLHIPIIPRESEMKTLLLGELYVCVFLHTHTYCTASELHWLQIVFLVHMWE